MKTQNFDKWNTNNPTFAHIEVEIPTIANPEITNLLIYNSLYYYLAPNGQELSYVDQTNSQKITFVQKIDRQSSALCDLFGTKYFNIAASGLTNFRRGVELPTLYALTQIMPFAKTDYEG